MNLTDSETPYGRKVVTGTPVAEDFKGSREETTETGQALAQATLELLGQSNGVSPDLFAAGSGRLDPDGPAETVERGMEVIPKPAGRKREKAVSEKRAEQTGGPEQTDGLAESTVGPLRKGYRLPWELEEWLAQLTKAFGEAAWHDGKAVGTTREIALIKILTFVRNLDRNQALLEPKTREGERLESRLWGLVGEFEPLLTQTRAALEELTSNLVSLDRKREASRLLLAQIQSTAVVVKGQVVRGVPMVGADGKVTLEGVHLLQADMGDIPGSLKVRETFYLKWRQAVDAYRTKVGERKAPPESRGAWLEARAEALSIEQKKLEPELTELWTGLEPRLRDWLADQDDR